MLFCLELQLSKSLNQFALSLLMSPFGAHSWPRAASRTVKLQRPVLGYRVQSLPRDVATLRFYSSRPVPPGDDEIKTKIRKPPNSAPMFARLFRIVPGAFDLPWIRHSFGLVMHSAVVFEEYPSGLCSIFDSANKYREAVRRELASPSIQN